MAYFVCLWPKVIGVLTRVREIACANDFSAAMHYMDWRDQQCSAKIQFNKALYTYAFLHDEQLNGKFAI
jgi:hypothetical protein